MSYRVPELPNRVKFQEPQLLLAPLQVSQFSFPFLRSFDPNPLSLFHRHPRYPLPSAQE
ncbi:hypothetical protein Hanom_Chr13g01198721 [Helianthus anomalus]